MLKYNKKISVKAFKTILNEILEPRTTAVEKSEVEYIDELSKYIGKPVVSGPIDDTYVIEFHEPHYAVIKPVVHDIFDYTYYRDKSDRTRGIYVKFDELKKILKSLVDKDNKNYVDSAYDKNVENSKYKEKITDPDKHTVEFEAEETFQTAKDMNEEIDNPDQPMREVGKFKKLSDYEETKVKYIQPKLSKEDSKLKIKIDKTEKFK